MSYPFRYVRSLVLLLSLLLFFHTAWGQSEAETPKNQVFLPIVAGGDAEVSQNSDSNSDDLDSVAPPPEYFPDEPEVALDPDSLVQGSSLPPFTISTIDSTEDYQALGYPDSRKIVRDSSGKLYVAYRKKINNIYRIFVAQSSDNGNTWSILNNGQPVEGLAGYTQRVPALAIDNQDRLHLLWYGNDAGNTGNQREIKYTRSVMTIAGLSWEPWRNLYDGGNYAGQTLWQEHPALYVNGSNVYAVWESHTVRSSTENPHIKFRLSIDYGVTWSSVVTVRSSSTVSFSRPTLVVSYAGPNNTRYLYLFAYGTQKSGQYKGIAQIYWSRSSDHGVSWSSWQAVASSPPADQRHVTVARDTEGKLHVVWRQVSNGRTILRYRLYDPAANNNQGGWGTPETIATVSQRCLFFPSITISSNNQRWVAWTQSADCTTVPNDDPKDGQIFYSVKPVNGNWSSPTALTISGKHLYATLRRANSPTATSGNVDVVWLDISATDPPPSGAEVDCTAVKPCWIRHTTLGGW